jgi:DNA-binding transcriptional LysR family regulator
MEFDMNFRQLRYFLAAAEAESVSKATHEIAISPSAITSAIQALEYDLGVTLFVRHAKGMQLTSDGHIFLLHARRILGAVADARRSIGGHSNQVKGEISLGVTRMVAGYYLADVLARFRRVFPEVTVRVIEDERAYLEHLLLNGELDIGLVLTSNLQDRQALEAEVLVRSPWRVWLPAGHPLLCSHALGIHELVPEPIIMFDMDELAETTTSFWESAGLQPNILLRTTSVEAVRSLVGRGVGVAMLPDMAFRTWSLEGDRLEARELASRAPTVDVGLVWRRGAPLSHLASNFLDICLEYSPSHVRFRAACG